jgi:hypothetical protein
MSSLAPLSVSSVAETAPTAFAIPRFKDTVETLSGEFLDIFLKPYFALTYRPIRKLDCINFRAGIRIVEFQITEVPNDNPLRFKIPNNKKYL